MALVVSGIFSREGARFLPSRPSLGGTDCNASAEVRNGEPMRTWGARCWLSADCLCRSLQQSLSLENLMFPTGGRPGSSRSFQRPAPHYDM